MRFFSPKKRKKGKVFLRKMRKMEIKKLLLRERHNKRRFLFASTTLCFSLLREYDDSDESNFHDFSLRFGAKSDATG